MLDQRLGNVEQDYASIYSFKMTVQDMIQRSSANRPKRKPPFYFDGGAYASYNLTEVAPNLNMIRVKKHQAREEENRVTEQRSFLIDRTESPNPPEVVEFNGRRFVRDYSGATRLKQIYGYSCQVCGCTVATFECVRADACGYAEVHHIKPWVRATRGLIIPETCLYYAPTTMLHLIYPPWLLTRRHWKSTILKLTENCTTKAQYSCTNRAMTLTLNA